MKPPPHVLEQDDHGPVDHMRAEAASTALADALDDRVGALDGDACDNVGDGDGDIDIVADAVGVVDTGMHPVLPSTEN
jgi:hypothetical protein